MNTTYTFIVVIQVISALAIIALVLLQHGKGADMGAAFGSGASGSLFGATGSSNFLSKSTGFAAAVFFIATLTLAYLGNNRNAAVGGGVMDNLPKTPVNGAASTPANSNANPVVKPSSSSTGSNAIPGPGSSSVATPAPTAPATTAPSVAPSAVPSTAPASSTSAAPAGGAQNSAPGAGQSGQIPR
ncbi:MAG: preprotein translocase subunit SecG [Pseudomonadota bacterium]